MRFIIIVILICCVSCKGNQAKEKNVSFTENISDSGSEQIEDQGFFMSDNSEYFRYGEIRRIDAGRPPDVIDIIGNRTNPSDRIKLSRFFDKIEYIVIKQNLDTITGKPAVSPGYIYILDYEKGLARFNKQGEFVQYICKNFYPHTKQNGMTMVNKEQGEAFYGATDAYWNDGKLYYKYEDRPKKKSFMIAFDENSQDAQVSDVEQNSEKLRLGTVVSEFSKNVRNSKFITGNLWVLPQGGKGYQETDFLTIMTANGDIICSFKDYDPVKDYKKSNMRGVDSGDSYLLNGIYNIRQSFNDTLYMFTPPNMLTSKYILDFGDLGIKSSNEGVDIGIGLENKLVGPKLFESDKYLFITYTKDYSCPANAQSGSLKFSRLIFDKNNKNLITLYVDKAPDFKGVGWPEAPPAEVENDLDGMPFIWPTDLTSEGKPFALIPATELSKKNNKPERLKNVGENDYVVIIYN